METITMENQMENNMENEMETREYTVSELNHACGGRGAGSVMFMEVVLHRLSTGVRIPV